MSLKKILIAVDESPFSERAAEVGIQLANALKAELALVHVFNPTATPAGAWGFPADRISEMSQLEGKRTLAKFRENLPPGVTLPSGIREFLESGGPAEAIVEVAKKWRADLIVMGSHGRGKVTGILMGSVSQDVVRNAPCPILVTPPNT